jgi:hypothetical protein
MVTWGQHIMAKACGGTKLFTSWQESKKREKGKD